MSLLLLSKKIGYLENMANPIDACLLKTVAKLMRILVFKKLPLPELYVTRKDGVQIIYQSGDIMYFLDLDLYSVSVVTMISGYVALDRTVSYFVVEELYEILLRICSRLE